MEAVLLFPAILLIVTALLMVGLLLYAKMGLYQQAVLTADRTAAHWGNAAKDPVTGAFWVGSRDGLYDRLLGGRTSGMGWMGGSGASITLPEQTGSTASGAAAKLSRGASLLPPGVTGTFRFHNRLLLPVVELDTAADNRRLSLLTSRFAAPSLEAKATSWITDPVETIRLTDLLRTFVGSWTEKWKSEQVQAAVASEEPRQQLVIASEKEASEYIRKLTGGKKTTFPTETVGEARIIDSLDSDGVAHEAKYTVNQKNAREQIAKDMELVRKGVVKGVVWHFFRHQKNGQTGLTASLKKELEKNGIVIVIHN
ncbi:hypothetical protein J31TS4_05780 [Paenibacillus sp. J31TS4]|uniref:hypothetical protein n=1 Tax=Paenibacillus sp. J31TS4 TaxID=2807195 RepID=UPI001B10D0FF|nr:hypothetical protein [Paenibacillus sp. J31TS4]GIP37298.1 hypothetical protein J31TS4_05780 [Paenibacillus sp. J31TS4]